VYGLKAGDIQYLERLKGGEVEQVCVGKYDLQFHLHPQVRLSIQSRCELVAANGTRIDLWEDGIRSDNFRFTDLLGGIVVDVFIDNSTTLRLRFKDGRQLLVYDTSTQYESFSVDNMYV